MYICAWSLRTFRLKRIFSSLPLVENTVFKIFLFLITILVGMKRKKQKTKNKTKQTNKTHSPTHIHTHIHTRARTQNEIKIKEKKNR